MIAPKHITKHLVNAALYLHRKALMFEQDCVTRAEMRAYRKAFSAGVHKADADLQISTARERSRVVFKQTAAELRNLPKEYI